MRQEWNNFKQGIWTKEINVRNFIQKNYTPYEGNDSFLCNATKNTKELWEQVMKLTLQEREKGGVLDMDTKIIFMGVGLRKCTFRHYAEYVYMEKMLEKAKKSPKYEELKNRVWTYDRWNEGGVWTHVDSLYVQEVLDKEGKLKYAKCGEADIIMVSAKDFVDCALSLLEKRDPKVFYEEQDWWKAQDTIDWLEEVDKI